MADIYSSDMKFKKTDTLLEDGGWVAALVNAAWSRGRAAVSNPVTAAAGNVLAYDGFFNNGEGLKTAAINIQNTVMGLAPDILPSLSNIATGLFESADPQVKRERNRVLKLDQRVQKLFYTASMKKYIKQECNRLLAEYKKKDPAATKQVVDGINQASKKLAGKKEQDVKKKVTKYREATMNIDGFDILVFGTTKDISRVAVVLFSPARKNPILRTIKIPTMQDLKAAKESVELVGEGTNAEVLFHNEVAICESVLREYNEGIVTEGLTDRIKQLGEQAWTSLKEMIKYLRSLLSGLWEKIRGSKKVADKVVKDAGPAKAKERTIHVDYLTLDAFSGSSAYTLFFEAFRSIHEQIKRYSTAKTVEEKEKFRERIEKNQHQIMAIMRKGASYNHDFSLAEVAKAMETLGKLVQIVEAQIGIFQDLEDEMKRDAKPIGFQATAPDAYSFEAAKQTLSLYMDFYAKLRADAEKLASLLAQASGEATQESALADYAMLEAILAPVEIVQEFSMEQMMDTLSQKYEEAKEKFKEIIQRVYWYFMEKYDQFMKFLRSKTINTQTLEINNPQFDYKKYNIQKFVNNALALYAKRESIFKQITQMAASNTYTDKMVSLYDELVENSDKYMDLFNSYEGAQYDSKRSDKKIKLKGSEVIKMLDVFKQSLDAVKKAEQKLYPQEAFETTLLKFIETSGVSISSVSGYIAKMKSDVNSFDVIHEFWFGSERFNSISFIARVILCIESSIHMLEHDIQNNIDYGRAL